MYRVQCVLAVVALYVGVAHSWDFAVGSGDQLTFHTNNGTVTDRVRIHSRNLGGLAYDEVHNRMLYVDKQDNNDTICGYKLSSKENVCFIGRSGRNILNIAYDPVTERLFFTDANDNSINWISLKCGSENNLYGFFLIKLVDGTPDDIAVDSCRGYIYWSKKGHTSTVKDTERARFGGSGREALDIDYESYDVCSLTIDPETQKIYYLDYHKDVYSMNIANMNGRNAEVKFLRNWSEAKEITVSKDYVYFITATSGESYTRVWRASKKQKGHVDPEEICKFYTDGSLGLAANYKIEDQIKGIQNCDSLANLLPIITEVPGTTERCDVCVDYCFKGNCSIDDDGLPKCSCNVRYSGERCDVFSCRDYCLNDGECDLNGYGDLVCQCKRDYFGDRCQVSGCLNYCFKGNCSLSVEGLPTCSCDAGYSGDRCEVSACYGYCLNDGECSLNEEDDPVCQCAGNHEGARCEADTTPTYDLTKRNLTIADLLSIWGKRSSRMFVNFEVQP